MLVFFTFKIVHQRVSGQNAIVYIKTTKTLARTFGKTLGRKKNAEIIGEEIYKLRKIEKIDKKFI